MPETDLKTNDKLKKDDKVKNKSPSALFPLQTKKAYFYIMHTLNFFRFLLYPWNSIFYPCKMFGHKR